MRRTCLHGQAELNDVAETIFPRPDKDWITGKKESFISKSQRIHKQTESLPPPGPGEKGARRRCNRRRREVKQDGEKTVTVCEAAGWERKTGRAMKERPNCRRRRERKTHFHLKAGVQWWKLL